MTGEAVTELEKAEQIRKSRMAPFTTAERVERLKTLRAAVADAEGQHTEAVERARPRIPLADAWSRYLAAQNRPDAGPSTLRQYSFQWAAFTRWLAVQCPDVSALWQVGPDMAEEYSQRLQQEGLSPGTINKHVLLLKLVFRVLGRAEGTTANPFADRTTAPSAPARRSTPAASSVPSASTAPVRAKARSRCTSASASSIASPTKPG